MAVKKKPESFVSCDGQEFATEADAESHDAVVKAVREFDIARDRLGEALANATKTADGELFELRRWRSYHLLYLFGNFGPCLRKIDFGWGTKVALGGSDNERVELVLTENNKDVHYAIDELYSVEANAKAALAQAIREHIEQKKKELKSL